ncbi:TIGR02452 family protein [Myxococcota bacterium]
MDRQVAAQLGRETVEILETGSYTNSFGNLVSIQEQTTRAVAGTVTYPPDVQVITANTGTLETRVEVTSETTLAAAYRLGRDGQKPVALNFASAKKPGGGFLNGARAQEESLARASGLYACIRDNPIYAFHKEHPDPIYASYVIYSPAVPVFRDDDGALLDEPYPCAFITAAAPNAKIVLKSAPSRQGEVRAAMDERIHRVLGIAAMHEHDALVLGAWGCGVFGNDTDMVAQLFRSALDDAFRGAFERVIFAIADPSGDRHFIAPFEKRFGQEST